MKKTIAILLALLLVAPAAVSCAGDTEKPETDFASESTDAATETTVETKRTRQYLKKGERVIFMGQDITAEKDGYVTLYGADHGHIDYLDELAVSLGLRETV